MKVGDYVKKLEMDNTLDGNVRDLLYTHAVQSRHNRGPNLHIDGCASLFVWAATPPGIEFWSHLHSEGW